MQLYRERNPFKLEMKSEYLLEHTNFYAKAFCRVHSKVGKASFKQIYLRAQTVFSHLACYTVLTRSFKRAVSF